jgi:RNase P subunit RPR2
VSAVAVPTRSPEVLARKRSTCADCSEPIVQGQQYIVKVDGKGWMHATCAADYIRRRELVEELNQDTTEELG